MKNLLILLLSVIVFSANATVKLPKLVSNGMVLQRNAEVKIWGWADRNDEFSATAAVNR